MWGCPVFRFKSFTSISVSPPTFDKFAKSTILFEPVPVTLTLPPTVSRLGIETPTEVIVKFPATEAIIGAAIAVAATAQLPSITVKLSKLADPQVIATSP